MKIPDPCGSLTVKDQIKEEHKMPFEIDNMLEETPQTIKVVGVGDGREGVFLRREDFLNGRHAELKPEENDDKRDDDARKILDARVAKRVLFIRRFTCHFKADERDNGRAGICEVVDGIGRDGNTVKNRADDNLH